MKVEYFEVEMRDPFCGAWVPMEIRVETREGEDPIITLSNTEGYIVRVKKLDAPKLFNH